ncbi:Major facilitator superfamily domain-containing protein 10 [Papilio machaon]|uniref:Major facilitator superfamily domain-containing protein 10 n=1 Tax=Papilio machaon TaxID=76193 RepID=A0A194QTJ4_PAPMA|nr:Major facilitator superfamily domain-containing protein 10 [Papilio machaon]
MILPLLPSLLDYYDKEEGKGNSLYASLVYAVRSFQKLTGAPDRFASVLFGGALGSMYSFLQFLTSPIVGSLSDAYGRKPMLLICLLGIAVSHALWSCASTFSMFVLARFIGGLSKANVSLSMAIVTDASGEKTRARGMALVGLAFSIGFIVGPMAGAWFAMTTDTNFGLWGQRPALYALSLSLANIALVSLLLPETLSKLGIAVSHALWSCASTFSMFVLARFIGGLSKANVSLSMAIVTDASGEKTRARGMALVGLAFSIGFIVGPMAGAWFAMTTDTNFGLWGQRPALYALSLSLANIALVSLFLPETLSKDKRAPFSLSLSKAIEYVSPWHLLKFSAFENLSQHQNKVLSKLGLIYFLYLFIYSGLEFTITFLTHHTFAYTAMQQGKMFLVIGVIMAVLQGGAARRLGPRGAETAARLALALTPASFLCVALAACADPVLLSPITWLWAGLVLFALSTAFAVSCMTSLAAAQAPAGARGAVLGALRSLGALARAAGPLLASAAYWCSGAAVTYSLGSIVLIIPAVMLFRLKS